MSEKKNTIKLSMTFEFDLTKEGELEKFGNLCQGMLLAGYEDAVRGIGIELLQEARRRNLPIAQELEAVIEGGA